MQKLSCLTILAIFAAFLSVSISAQTPSIKLELFKSGLNSPVFITNAKDGTKRLFIIEQPGVIKVVQPGTGTVTNFLDIQSKVLFAAGGEQGLLGLAFHPQYATNRRFFVYYNRKSDGAIQIAEYQTSAANSNIADATEKIIITIPHPTNTNHNGGTIAFGPDGYLYAGTGDGGSANDPPNNAQNINQLLGKFLRLNIDVAASASVLYTSPSDNPYVGVNGADEIYAIGMRNPFRWSFDRGGTRQLYVADVGQGANEEVDIITKGGNYGWRIMEGNNCNPSINNGVCTPPTGYVSPIFQYNHSGGRCSITGGYIYRGTKAAVAGGAYVYGDYCTGEILMYSGGQQTLLLDSTRNISSFGEDEDGELYVVGLGGTIDKITPLNPTAATVAVAGRVITANGRGIRGVVVRLTDSSGNVRVATSASFGYYNFADVAAGETYVITAKGKRFTFSQPSQVLNITGENNQIDFVANQ